MKKLSPHQRFKIASERVQMERKQLTGLSTKLQLKTHINSDLLRSEVMRVVSEVFDVDPELIKGRSRVKKIAHARHAYCFLAMSLDPSSTLGSLGKSVDRDHSTMINSIRKCNNLRESDFGYSKQFRNCIESLLESSDKNLIQVCFKPEHLERNFNQRQRLMEQALASMDIVRDFMNMCDQFVMYDDGATDSDLIKEINNLRMAAAKKGF
jgi:hypothetical protein